LGGGISGGGILGGGISGGGISGGGILGGIIGPVSGGGLFAIFINKTADAMPIKGNKIAAIYYNIIF
jgi:hypothetical protein